MYQKEYSNGMSGNMITNLNLIEMAGNVPCAEFVTNEGGFAFTPTTLAKFESTLSDLNDDLAASAAFGGSGLKSESAANCLWAEMSDYSESDSEDSSNSGPATKRSKTSANLCAGFNSSRIDQRTGRKLPGPRPTRNLDNMTPIEAERRQKRRERNKTAAARCRQRRVDVTNELLAETETLEREAEKLEREIETLLRQKNQLEYVLEAHKPLCSSDGLISHQPVAVTKSVKSETNATVLANAPTSQQVTISAVRPNSLAISTSSGSSTGLDTAVTSCSMFSFTNTSLSTSGMTPMYFSNDLMSPSSSYMLLSPSMLIL